VSPLKIQAVLFDLGNTLVKLNAPEIVFQRVLRSLGIMKPRKHIELALQKTNNALKNDYYTFRYGKVPCKEYWRVWDSFVLKHLGIIDSENLSKEIHQRWFDYACCRAYSDVKGTLSKLKSMGLRIGIISTGYEEDIYRILRKAYIRREFFDVIVGADTIKKVKPHPDVFKIAIKRLNAKPETTLFIGDKIDEDYAGSRKLGMNALLLDRKRSGIKQVSISNTIHSLKEILKYVE
jgi:HAD superfamily hydrolase (TIGR01549 family)